MNAPSPPSSFLTDLRPQLRLLVRAVVFAALFAGVAEVVLRTAMPARESPYPRQEPLERLMTFDPIDNARGTFTAGRYAQLRVPYSVNAQGWNAGEDYMPAASRTEPLLAVLGDSQIEGFYVDWSDHIAQRLERTAGGAFVGYAFGGSGYRLAQFPPVTRYLARTGMSPQVVVLLLDVGDLAGSLRTFGVKPGVQYIAEQTPDGAGFVEVPPTPYQTTPSRRLLRQSAIARYLLFNAKLDLFGQDAPAEPALGAPSVPPESQPENTATLDAYVEWSVAAMRAALPDARFVLLLDADRRAIYRGDTPVPVLPTTPFFERACARHPDALACVDLAPVFDARYRADGQRFDFDFNPHWSAHGHAVAAEAVFDALRARGWLPGPRGAE